MLLRRQENSFDFIIDLKVKLKGIVIGVFVFDTCHLLLLESPFFVLITCSYGLKFWLSALPLELKKEPTSAKWD